MENIIALANKLGEAIKETEEMKKMNEIEEKYNSDPALGALVGEYNALCQTLNDAYVNGNGDGEATKNIEQRITELYNEINSNPIMDEYQKAHDAVNKLMQKVNGEIEFGITGVRHEECCSGNCSGCSGCH